MSEKEKIEIIIPDEKEKTKNPKRVSAGKKGAEAKKMKAELKRKEMEEMKKENIQFKSITRDDDEVKENKNVNTFKNYIPLFLIGIGVAGLGLYMYKSKKVGPPIQREPPIQRDPTIQKKEEIDPFEFP